MCVVRAGPVEMKMKVLRRIWDTFFKMILACAGNATCILLSVGVI